MSDIIGVNSLISVPAMFSASGYVTNAQWRRIDMSIVTSNKACNKCGGHERTSKRECVNCKKLRDKQYREKNSKKIKDKKREYRIKNSDKIRAHRLAFYHINKDRILAGCRAWKQRNPEKVRAHLVTERSKESNLLREHEYSKEWRRKNPERAKEQGRKWRRENPEKSIANCHARRARVAGNGGTYTKQEWLDLLDLYGHKCLCCGRNDVKLCVDHVIPIVKGGRNTIDNIQPLCKSCNSKKCDKIIDYRKDFD